MTTPEPTLRTRHYIDGLASRIAGKLALTPGEDLTAIVTRLGGELVLREWHHDRDEGSIKVRSASDFTIYLSPFTGPLRDRFTVAHELGHYFLHSLAGRKPIQVIRRGSSAVEWEANWFAAAFLMPAQDFKDSWDSCEGKIEALAAHFYVSTDAIESRRRYLSSLSTFS